MELFLPPSSEPEAETETAELESLLNALWERYGVDFRSYTHSTLKRRVLRRVEADNAGTISGLKERVLADSTCMERLLLALTIHVTAMFRDPGFYLDFRQIVVPVLRTYPFLRFWAAGCSTGEEVYSLAILLHEEGLYPRCRIYATDLHDRILDRARAGVFPLAVMQDYTRNYQKAGGRRAFGEYYTAGNDYVVFRPFLRDNVVFASHNLVGDASFNEFHGILCRNVMIYFNRSLQNRVHKLLYESLVLFGFLGLGRSESLRFSSCEDRYEAISAKERLYRRIR